MTTSSTTILELTRDDIIEQALRKLAVLAKGQTPDSEDLDRGADALNALITFFQTQGMELWKRVTLGLVVVEGQVSYTIGIGQANNYPFPLKVMSVELYDTVSNTAVDMMHNSIYEYNRLSSAAVGTPVVWTYQPKINLGVLQIWPMPDATIAATKLLNVTYTRPFEVFTAGTDTADFPQEWKLPLIYQLAVLLAPEYGVPLEDRRALMLEADKYLGAVLQHGTDDGSIFFQPDVR